MCLDIKDSKIDLVYNKKYGYKIFQKSNTGSIVGQYFLRYYKIGEWNKAPKIKLKDYMRNLYEGGFHILHSLEDAKKWKKCYNHLYIFKIEFRNVVATGKQRGLKIIVAREMKILKEVK